MIRNLLLALFMAAFSIFSIQARDIYVAKNGDDTNDGSIENPYLTLAKAASEAEAGDTVYIRQGTYEESLVPINSGIMGSPIVFTSYPGEKVIISAMQSLSGWTNDSGAIYKTTIDWDLGQENFVMNGSTAMDLARWPNNVDGNPFTIDSARNDGGSNSAAFASRQGFLTDSEIPNIDWTGGALFFYGDKPGAGWLAWKEFITSSSSGRVDFSITKDAGVSWIYTVHAPADQGDFYLEGAKGALDYQNEWWFDTAANELFVQLPNGVAPSDGTIQMRRRVTTIDLSNRSFIEIRNLAVFGGSIEMNNSSNDNLLYGISSFYGAHTQGIFNGFAASKQSMTVQGMRNRVEKCEIAFGAATGIRVGGTSNEVINCNIHDFGFLGSYDAPVIARGGTDYKIFNNSIYNGGRDAINYNGPRGELAYNDVYKSNLIADDCALFYTVGRNGEGTEIHHNWFHDTASRGDKFKAAGIYLDNDPGGFLVHHNVVWNTEWTGVQMNWDALDIDIFNNTLINNSAVMGAWHKEGTAFSNVKVWNNLGDNDEWEPQSDKQNNLVVDNNVFTNAATGDFSLKDGTAPIDAGREISDITNGFLGTAPDVGAYEFGGEKWVAGIDWDPRFGPTGLGCFGLPGENCQDGPLNDADSDGVSDALDQCPDTPDNTTVDSTGCPIFTLAANNFTVFGEGESCPGSGNGSISITAQENMDYTATISENAMTVNFSDNTTFQQLMPGTYTVCITVAGESDYEQCFNIVLATQDILSVSSKVDHGQKRLTLDLAGNDLYNIVLNGVATVTDKQSITLDLKRGKNELSVSTSLECQSNHIQSIYVQDGIIAYPNPNYGELTLGNMPTDLQKGTLEIFSVGGQLMKKGSVSIANGSIQTDLSTLPNGLYVLRLSSNSIEYSTQIVKQ